MYQYEIRNADGTVCCAGNRPDFPRCEKCKGKTATHTASDDDYSPPDPYERGLAALRLAEQATAARMHSPASRQKEIRYDENEIPDPYYHDLEKLRSTR
jgi:hypothetical protein